MSLAVAACAPADRSTSGPAVTTGGTGPAPATVAEPAAPDGPGRDPAAAVEELCGTTSEAVAGGVVTTTVWRCYDMEGSDRRTVRQSLELLGPHHGGRRFHALTTWHVEWSYPASRRTGGACHVSGTPLVSLRVEHLFPRWTGRSAAPQELTTEWSRYITALRTHEDGHADIGRAVATGTLAMLRALSAPDCAGLRPAAEAAFAAILAEGRGRERAYDEATDHGATQGARFG